MRISLKNIAKKERIGIVIMQFLFYANMTYTWQFQPRPYTDEEAKTLLAPVMSPETTDWHYNKHHRGYVAGLNAIEEGLKTAAKDAANGNYSAYGELKRRQPFNHAGVVLHDLYWQNLGGNGDHTVAPALVKKIEADFESFENWQEDLQASGMSTKLGGWAVLTWDRLYSGRLLNVIVDEHQNGAIWGGIPLIALDMFEHAYYHKDGPGRPTFIKNFFENLHWGRIEQGFRSADD